MLFLTKLGQRNKVVKKNNNIKRATYNASSKRMFSSSQKSLLENVVIASAVRTPVGSFNGTLSSVKGTKLASTAITGALSKASISPSEVEEVYLGNVLQAGQGQAPATQASLGADIPPTVPCTTVNKVCASGMKTVMLAASSIALGHQSVIVAGGFENMSKAPYYADRGSLTYGHQTLKDAIVFDGLWDVYNDFHMGNCGEDCSKRHGISREAQDEYAIGSYKKAAEAVKAGHFKDEIVNVSVPQRRGDPIVVSEDEEYKKVKFDKVPGLRPAFMKGGTITAANASSINDGASALVIMSEKKAQEKNIKPLAKIIGYADAARKPIEFTDAPADAIPKALKLAGLKIEDIDFWEINEAFSVVVLANIKILGLDKDKVNVRGGGVSLGHPIGASGARITTTLAHLLNQTGKKYGCASICNGGGGASAIIIENLNA